MWLHIKKKRLIEMATTVPPSHVAPCELKNDNHSYCIDETTTCNLNSGLGVMGYNNMGDFDPITTPVLSGSDDAKLRSQKSQLTTIQSHRVRILPHIRMYKRVCHHLYID